VEYIEKRDKVTVKIDAIYTQKKELGKPLPKLIGTIKELQAEIEVLKATQTEKLESKETFDKQLDTINEKRKKDRDNRDKFYKSKDELRNTHYSALIEHTKQEYLLADIKWMTEMQGKLKERKDEKEKRDKEYKDRKAKIEKEREEKK